MWCESGCEVPLKLQGGGKGGGLEEARLEWSRYMQSRSESSKCKLQWLVMDREAMGSIGSQRVGHD